MKTSHPAAVDRARTSHRSSRRFVLRAVGAVTAALLLSAAVIVGLRLARPGVLPGVVLADVELGGLDRDELRDAVADLARRRTERPIIARTSAAEVTTTGGELGYALGVEATVERVWRRGRQANPLAALADQLRAFTADTTVQPVDALDQAALHGWVADAVAVLEVAPVEGDLQISGTTVTPVDPAPGAAVDEAAFRRALTSAVLAGEAAQLQAPTTPVAPATTTEDVAAVQALAAHALSAPVALHRNGATVTLAPEQIGAVLDVAVSEDGDDPTLALVGDAGALEQLVPDATVATLETTPVDAGFDVSDGSVSIVEAVNGFAFDPRMAADQVVELATGTGAREAELRGQVLEPERTTAEAQALGITEQVSTFTTNHACCQSRVTNIHRIADIVDGVVVEPGAQFSLNDFVGERTPEKGFAEGGAILDGEYVSDVGGGVSQFATTFFNAAFFGGYEFVEYKPHSYYISRYPIGREATINYPNVDLEIRNNSPHGIYVDTSYTDTSVTVTFYGTKWVEVESITGEPYNHRGPRTIVRENPDLPAGRERVVQSGGGQGFEIQVTRVLRFPDGREEREVFTTTYLAESRIVERGTGGVDEPPPGG